MNNSREHRTSQSSGLETIFFATVSFFLAQVSIRPYATLHSLLLFIVCQHSQ
jgi:hypothetical protein